MPHTPKDSNPTGKPGPVPAVRGFAPGVTCEPGLAGKLEVAVGRGVLVAKRTVGVGETGAEVGELVAVAVAVRVAVGSAVGVRLGSGVAVDSSVEVAVKVGVAEGVGVGSAAVAVASAVSVSVTAATTGTVGVNVGAAGGVNPPMMVYTPPKTNKTNKAPPNPAANNDPRPVVVTGGAATSF